MGDMNIDSFEEDIYYEEDIIPNSILQSKSHQNLNSNKSKSKSCCPTNFLDCPSSPGSILKSIKSKPSLTFMCGRSCVCCYLPMCTSCCCPVSSVCTVGFCCLAIPCLNYGVPLFVCSCESVKLC